MSNGTAPGEGHPGPAGTEYTLQGKAQRVARVFYKC